MCFHFTHCDLWQLISGDLAKGKVGRKEHLSYFVVSIAFVLLLYQTKSGYLWVNSDHKYMRNSIYVFKLVWSPSRSSQGKGSIFWLSCCKILQKLYMFLLPDPRNWSFFRAEMCVRFIHLCHRIHSLSLTCELVKCLELSWLWIWKLINYGFSLYNGLVEICTSPLVKFLVLHHFELLLDFLCKYPDCFFVVVCAG